MEAVLHGGPLDGQWFRTLDHPVLHIPYIVESTQPRRVGEPPVAWFEIATYRQAEKPRLGHSVRFVHEPSA
ncbi:hypothetical protein SK069_05860 [Patulibacter brassicae]|uniref:Uncharacterized protein n=1 Tax=Patulibacter brassicae TaxID=1705717 RepID=A0ABU4VI50_9ACTN|nr:hypothetical protein [Patulibacter brassicae]MDX8151110.1 hypothetical protein [Patulibacter brassicae]